jgi:hypothetical protein
MTASAREPSDDDVLRNLREAHDDELAADDLEVQVRQSLLEDAPAPPDAAGDELSDAELLRNLRQRPADLQEDLDHQRILRALTDGAPRRRSLRRRVPPPPGPSRRPLQLPRVVVQPEPTPMEEALTNHDEPFDFSRVAWVGLTLAGAARAWEGVGFTPVETRAWRAAGVMPGEQEVAAALRDFGLTPASAARSCFVSPHSYRSAVEAARAGVPLEHIVDALSAD